jgi:hypothetical protein
MGFDRFLQEMLVSETDAGRHRGEETLMGAHRTVSLVLLVGLGLLRLGSGTAQARQHRIRETRLHGGAEVPIPTASSVPAGIGAGPDGNVWFTEYRGNSVDVLRP